MSHGICLRCAERARLGLDEPPRVLRPGHWLVVVGRPHRNLFWRLRRDFLDLPRAYVIFDRRRAERRRAWTRAGEERRRGERRRTLDRRERELWRFGVHVIEGAPGRGDNPASHGTSPA